MQRTVFYKYQYEDKTLSEGGLFSFYVKHLLCVFAGVL